MFDFLHWLGWEIVDCEAAPNACFSNSESGAIVTFWYYVGFAGLVILFLHWDAMRAERRKKDGD